MSFEDASAQDTWRVRYLEELPPVGGALETVTLTPVEDGAETPFVLDCPGVAPEASPIEQPVRSECDDFEGTLEEVLATYPRDRVDVAESELGGMEEASSSILWEYGHPDVQVGGFPSFAQSDAWRDRAEDLLLFQDETIDEAIVGGGRRRGQRLHLGGRPRASRLLERLLHLGLRPRGVPGPRSDSRGESDPAEGPASFWP